MTDSKKPAAAVLGVDADGEAHLVMTAGADEKTRDELRRALDRTAPSTRPELEADLNRLLPLLVPAEYFDPEKRFPSVCTPLPAKHLALTWVILQPTTML